MTQQAVGSLLSERPETGISYYGTVTYERGFELVEINGWVREEGTAWVVVYGDPDSAPEAQRRTAVLKSRVVDVDLLPTT